MPVFLLTDDALHVQPLHPRGDHVVRLFEPLGFGTHGATATARLDARKAGRFLGLFANRGPLEEAKLRPATHEELLGLTKYRFRLEGLRKIAVGATFPDLTVEVLGPSIHRETYDLTPKLPRWTVGPASALMRSYARSVSALLNAAREGGWPCERIAGWLDRPAVEWEPATFPEPDTKRLPTYRSAPAQQERILAERGPGGTFERLVRRLLPRGRRSPSRVVVTADDIFAEFARHGVFRLPRGLARRAEGRDVIFGRWAGMRLEERDAPCPVARLLVEETSG